MGTFSRNPSRLATSFLACFLLSNFTGVRRFFFVNILNMGSFCTFELISCILSVRVFLHFFLVCMCVWGRVVVRHGQRIPTRILPAGRSFSMLLFWFLILLVCDVFSASSILSMEIFQLWTFFLHSRERVFLSFIPVCVCSGIV